MAERGRMEEKRKANEGTEDGDGAPVLEWREEEARGRW